MTRKNTDGNKGQRQGGDISSGKGDGDKDQEQAVVEQMTSLD